MAPFSEGAAATQTTDEQGEASPLEPAVADEGLADPEPIVPPVELPAAWESFFAHRHEDSETIDRLYTEWRDVWLTWPEDYRHYFLPLIAEGNLTRQVYEWLGIGHCSVAEEDRVVTTESGKEIKVAATFSYSSNRGITMYPRLTHYSPRMVSHILGHEIGHAATGLINPRDYIPLVIERTGKWTWTNSKYTELYASEDDMTFFREMIAEDLSDFFQSPTPYDMLMRRLARAQERDVVKTRFDELEEDERNELVHDTERLYSFFQVMLDPTRQSSGSQRLTDVYEDAWFPEPEGFELIDPPEMAHEFWEPTPSVRNSAPRSTSPPSDSFSSLWAQLFGVEL